jgi:hypothetical protein
VLPKSPKQLGQLIDNQQVANWLKIIYLGSSGAKKYSARAPQTKQTKNFRKYLKKTLPDQKYGVNLLCNKSITV